MFQHHALSSYALTCALLMHASWPAGLWASRLVSRGASLASLAQICYKQNHWYSFNHLLNQEFEYCLFHPYIDTYKHYYLLACLASLPDWMSMDTRAHSLRNDILYYDFTLSDVIFNSCVRIYINICMCVYIYIYVYVYVCIHIYIYRERERHTHIIDMHTYCIHYIYIYIHIHTYSYIRV